MPRDQETQGRHGLKMVLRSAFHLAHSWMRGIVIQPLACAPLASSPHGELLVIALEFSPGSCTGRHFHRGEEFVTVVQGTIELHIDGQAPRTLHSGEAYHIPEGVVHGTRVLSETPARTMATLVLSQGQPWINRVHDDVPCGPARPAPSSPTAFRVPPRSARLDA